jgi:hypothetical protein
METSFEIAFRAWELNQMFLDDRQKTSKYNFKNENATKIPESEILHIIDRVLAGEDLNKIWEEKYKTICKIEAIRQRMRAKGIYVRKVKKQLKAGKYGS